MKCPCHSGLPYHDCCQQYHSGKSHAENALILMRSRYSAYALSLADYIMETTHPNYGKNPLLWRKAILDFCTQTTFEGLEILEFVDGKEKAFVTFAAKLMRNGEDASFQERSTFYKVDHRWLYYPDQLTSE